MPTDTEIREVAQRVSNWGRWGSDDQRGTLNHIGPEQIRHAATLVERGVSFSLGLDINERGIWDASSFRRNPLHLMTVDGGDSEYLTHHSPQEGLGSNVAAAMWGRGLTRFNDDMIIMSLQGSTQWDALAHVYYDDMMYNGVPAHAVTSAGASKLGIDQMANGVVGRGVLLDIARHRGLAHLPPNEAVEPEELAGVAAAQGVEIRTGDILVIRTGWLATFPDHKEPRTWRAGCPGLSWRCAEWLHQHSVAAVAADNTAVEASNPQIGPEESAIPLHLLCLRDMGMPFGELWRVEELAQDCAEDGRYEFQLVAPPLRVTGGVGTPLNPLALK